jgi:hypothetical protein
MFVLASNKDLAVSPLDFARGKPQVYTRIIRIARTLSPFGLRRLCSHLYHFWRRVLPAIFFDPAKREKEVRTFLPASNAERLPCLLEQLHYSKNKKEVKGAPTERRRESRTRAELDTG